MKHLQELSLERCTWFETHDLIMFSKLPNLKKLNLRGCVSLKECVPYGSIATRFGFRKLESLDIRDTPISDSDIQCFNITTTLRELLMECPVDLRNQTAARSGCCDLESVNEEDELRLEPNANERNEQGAQVAVEGQNQPVVEEPVAAAAPAAEQQQQPPPPSPQQQQQNENRDDDVRISNHYINIVVRNHNIQNVDIQNNVGERRDVVYDNPQMFVPNNLGLFSACLPVRFKFYLCFLVTDVNPQPQQLIIVRGLNCNTGNRDRAVGRRNR